MKKKEYFKHMIVGMVLSIFGVFWFAVEPFSGSITILSGFVVTLDSYRQLRKLLGTAEVQER